jgi:anti-sigma B factor antagonist
MSGLNVQVDKLGPERSVAVIRLEGYIDTQTGPLLATALNKLFDAKQFKIICHLEKVNYISSAGWGLFIGEIGRIRNQGGDLKLTGMMPEVEEVYRVLEFDVILKQYKNVDEALQHFS